MEDDPDPIRGYADSLAGGADMLDVLRLLRKNGFTKIESIQVLVKSGRWSLREANAAVHESEVWADVRERDEAFADTVADVIDELND
jgi:hypothetical protein